MAALCANTPRQYTVTVTNPRAVTSQNHRKLSTSVASIACCSTNTVRLLWIPCMRTVVHSSAIWHVLYINVADTIVVRVNIITETTVEDVLNCPPFPHSVRTQIYVVIHAITIAIIQLAQNGDVSSVGRQRKRKQAGDNAAPGSTEDTGIFAMLFVVDILAIAIPAQITQL